MVRLTSKSTGCSGLACWPADGPWLAAGAGVISLLRPGVSALRSSYLRSLPRSAAPGPAERAADRHREPDAGERVPATGVGDRHDDADDHAAAVQQRPARAARIDRRVELDQP